MSTVHGKASQLVTPHTLYQQLGKTPEDRQLAYRELFAEQLAVELICRATDVVLEAFLAFMEG